MYDFQKVTRGQFFNQT